MSKKGALYPVLLRVNYPKTVLYIVQIVFYDWAIANTRWWGDPRYPEYDPANSTGTLWVGVDIVYQEEYFESLDCAREFIRDWWQQDAV